MSKCVPILDQMPPEIMEKIVGYTDNKDKFQLRQCCKYFKQIVENSEIVFKNLKFSYIYSENWVNVCVAITGLDPINKSFDEENPGKPVENAMAALKFVEKGLKSHPKIRVVNLELEGNFETQELENSEHRAVMEEVSRVFSGLEYKLPVKTLIMEWMSDEQLLMSVLPHLVPGTLRKLIFRNMSHQKLTIELPRTVETEQWKQAKALIIGNYLSIDLEKTDHFKYIEYRVARLEVEDVKRIVEKFLSDNGWKRRSIYQDEYDFDAIKEYLLQFDHIIEETAFNHELQMTIRRDGYGCKIELNEFCGNWTFERIDSVS